MIWTSSNVDRLIELSNTKLSSTKIAIELGTTKNAVIGKLNRIKIKNGYVPKPMQVRNNRRLSVGYFKEKSLVLSVKKCLCHIQSMIGFVMIVKGVHLMWIVRRENE